MHRGPFQGRVCRSGQVEGSSDDPPESLLMECSGMQVFSVGVSSLDGAGDGTRTRDVQLGKLYDTLISII
jgi:hypothetical protein